MRATHEFRRGANYGVFGWDSKSRGVGIRLAVLGAEQYRSGVTLTLRRRACG